MRRLIFLLDGDDLACVEACCPEVLSGTVVAFDPDLHIQLLHHGLDHLTPWSVVRKDEEDELQKFERAVWGFWEDNAHAMYDGLDLLQMVKFRHLACFSRLAWAAYVIRKTFEAVCPQQVVAFEEPTGHGLEQPPEHNKMPLLQVLVRGMAEQSGRSVRLLSRDDVPGQGGFVDWVAKDARKQLAAVDVSEQLNGRPFVLFPGSGVDLVRQLPLVRELHEKGDFAVVQLYKSADESIIRRMNEVGHFVWHESQVTQHVPLVDVLPCAVEARRCFDGARQQAPSDLRAIFTNPYMDTHFDFIFGEYLRKMAWHVRAWESFFARHRPHMVITTSYSPVYEVAHALGMPCLGLAHGLMMIGHTRWFMCYPSSLIGAISGPHRDRLIRAGMEPERIRVTGDPWLDSAVGGTGSSPASALCDELSHWRAREAGWNRLRRRQCHPIEQPHHLDASDLRRKWSISPQQRVVLLVMGNMGMLAKLGGLPMYDWADAVRCFIQLGALAKRHPEWRLVVQPHPRYDHPQLYELANRELACNQRIMIREGESLESVVQAVDVVVICNIVTSAILESSLLHKPVVVLSQSMIWYHPHEWATEHWLHIPTVSALERELQTIFGNREHYDRRVRETQAAVRHYLAGSTEPAVSRCLDVIYESASRPINT